MKEFCEQNVFSKCSFEELETLYEEAKLYNHFADIPEASPLYKYIDVFLNASAYPAYSVFCLQLCRSYIDKQPSLYPLTCVTDDSTDFKKLLDKRIQENKNKPHGYGYTTWIK